MNQRKQTTKHTAETKLPWFSRLLRLSARKLGGLRLILQSTEDNNNKFQEIS